MLTVVSISTVSFSKSRPAITSGYGTQRIWVSSTTTYAPNSSDRRSQPAIGAEILQESRSAPVTREPRQPSAPSQPPACGRSRKLTVSRTSRYQAGSPGSPPATKLPSTMSRPAREPAGRAGEGLRRVPLGAPEYLIHHLTCGNTASKGYRWPLPVDMPVPQGPREHGQLATSPTFPRRVSAPRRNGHRQLPRTRSTPRRTKGDAEYFV